MEDLVSAGCLPATGGKKLKYRVKQRLGRGAFVIMSLLHLSIGLWLLSERDRQGWHLVGLSMFGGLLFLERSLAENLSLLGIYQLLMLGQTGHVLYDHQYPSSPLVAPLPRGPPPGELLMRHGVHGAEGSALASFSALRSAQVLNGTAGSLSAGAAQALGKSHDAWGGGGSRQQQQQQQAQSPLGALGSAVRDVANGLQGGGRRKGGRKPKPLGPGPPPIDPAIPLGFTADMANKSLAELQEGHPGLFEDMPRAGFIPEMKNPCWREGEEGGRLLCLPYAYLLGMPKCGSSDLWERLIRHPKVGRKEGRKEE